MAFKTLMICLVCFFNLASRAQDINVLLKDARQLETSFRENEALQKYLQVLQHQPSNITALCKASELYNLMGKRQPKKEKQKEYYRIAYAYAQKALKVNPNHSEANFVMSVAMGRMALISSGEEKVKAVKEVRTYAEKCVQLDPSNFKGYHVLGKWNYEVSSLSTVERWLAKITYGSLPKASFEEAIRNYEKSRQLNPGFILNYLELAKTYHRLDNDKKAREFLTAMMKLPDMQADDATMKAEAKKLLREYDDQVR